VPFTIILAVLILYLLVGTLLFDILYNLFCCHLCCVKKVNLDDYDKEHEFCDTNIVSTVKSYKLSDNPDYTTLIIAIKQFCGNELTEKEKLMINSTYEDKKKKKNYKNLIKNVGINK